MSLHLHPYDLPLMFRRPEQLILPDDQSFLPDFAFAPPALLADLDFSFNLDMARPGESQTLTPFGSQRSQSSSHIGAIGGLILPSSSPSVPGGLRFKGDNGPGSVGGASDMFGAGNILDLDEPDFTFDDDGDIIDFGDRDTEPKTPGVRGGATMSGDAGASARVRREHEEGRSAGVQVSFTVVSHQFLHRDLSSLSRCLGWLASLALSVMT